MITKACFLQYFWCATLLCARSPQLLIVAIAPRTERSSPPSPSPRNTFTVLSHMGTARLSSNTMYTPVQQLFLARCGCLWRAHTRKLPLPRQAVPGLKPDALHRVFAEYVWYNNTLHIHTTICMHGAVQTPPLPTSLMIFSSLSFSSHHRTSATFSITISSWYHCFMCTYVVSWDFNSSSEAWARASSVEMDAEVQWKPSGTIRGTVRGSAPHLDSPGFRLLTTDRHYVVVRMRSSGAGELANGREW